jgi:hypothetical protein
MRRQGDDVLVSVPPELAGREVVAARTRFWATASA